MPSKKTTPKPWKVHKPDLSGKPKERPTIVGPIHIKGNPKDGDLEMIARSPDMLEVLRELEQRMKTIGWYEHVDSPLKGISKEVLSLIQPILLELEEVEL